MNRASTCAKIYAFPHPVLREVSRQVPVDDPDTMNLVRQNVMALRETMQEARGWGLSAIQIGVPIQVFIVHVPGETREPVVFINPSIEAVSPEVVKLPEGCLSFAGVREIIERPAKVLVRRWTEHGAMDVCEFQGWTARAVQHEMDHLGGRLLIDYLSKPAQRMLERSMTRKQAKAASKLEKVT